jgi:hypothetical protein
VIYNTGVGLQIVEEMPQGGSASPINHSHGKMRRGGPNELGHLFGESFFDRLHRILGERNEI